MLKRSFISIAFAIMAMQPLGASATDLTSAFSSLVGGGSVTTTGPGSHSSATRNVFVAGGVEARFPRGTTRVSLISVTPPSMPTAGCGGISAHFGGFSFVGGAQIEQLIKNIGQNAIGVAVGVVLKELCPICQSVISEMTNLAQQASRLSIDSCAVATNIVQSLAKDDRGDSKVALKGTCGSYAASTGLSKDSLSVMQGVDSVCGTMGSAMKQIDTILKKAEGKDKDGKPSPDGPSEEAIQSKAEIKYMNTWGNKTWNTLNAVFGPLVEVTDDNGQVFPGDKIPKLTPEELDTQFRNRVLLMNLIGTEIVTAPGDKRGNAMEFKNVINPSLSAKNLFDLYMCGAAPKYEAGNAEGIVKTRNSAAYCKYFYGNPADKDVGSKGSNAGFNWVVWECPKKDNMGNDNIGTCVLMEQKTLQSSDLLKGAGFLPQVESILFDAVKAVRENEKEFKPEFIKLTQSVNFPIYQAINAAAVYPAATNDLLSTMSVLVAESLVYTQLEDLLAAQGRNPDYAGLQRESAARLYEALAEMNRSHLSRKESYGRLMTMQEGAVHAIRQVNLAVQKQVLTPELLGNTRYGIQNANAVAEPKK
jgi:hypothetical protein